MDVARKYFDAACFVFLCAGSESDNRECVSALKNAGAGTVLLKITVPHWCYKDEEKQKRIFTQFARVLEGLGDARIQIVYEQLVEPSFVNILSGLVRAGVPVETRFWTQFSYMHINIFITNKRDFQSCLSCFQHAPDFDEAAASDAPARQLLSEYEAFVRHVHSKYEIIKARNLVVENYYQDITDVSKYFDYDVFGMGRANFNIIIKSYEVIHANLQRSRKMLSPLEWSSRPQRFDRE